jgi:TetR/AcrR family transcriptional regulator, transcriptional repressor for nem operon
VHSVNLTTIPSPRETISHRSIAIEQSTQTRHQFLINFLTVRGLLYILVCMLKVSKNRRRRAPKLRNPEQTRDRLLQAAFREVFRRGFQSAGIDAILAATNVTKGALYYHFENKEALGYAVIEEIVAKLTGDRWLLPLQQGEDDPVDTLIGIVRALPNRPRDVKRGCALANLAQEMSQLDEQFRKRLERIFHAWQEGIAMALRRGQSQGAVRRDLVPEETASFLVAMIEGYQVLAKNAQDAKVWSMGIRNIVGWLNSLRAPGNRHRA